MTLRTSLTITGDTEGAQQALAELQTGMARTETAAERLATAERVAEAATEGLEAELRQALATIGAVESDLAGARDGMAALSGRIDVLETKLGRASAAGRANTKSLGEQALGARMLGQQFQDMGVMASMSTGSATDVLRIFSTQIGQTALAVEQMGVKGAIGRFATFMGTPWGAALTGAALVAAPLVAKLFEFGDAAEEAGKKAEQAAAGADAYGAAQSDLAKLIDLTTGSLKSHNTMLAESIRLEAIFKKQQGEKEAETAEKAIRSQADAVYSTPYGGAYMGPGGPGGGAVQLSNPQFKSIADRFLAGGFNTTEDPTGVRSARIELEKLAGAAGKLDGKNVHDFTQSLLELGKAREKINASQNEVDAIDGKGLSAELKQGKAGGRTRRNTSSSTVARDEFGRDAADRIASINESFSETPTALQQADKALRQLDDLIGDLAAKGGKDNIFAGVISSAEAAKQTVEIGLIRSLGAAFEAPKTLADKAAEALDTLNARLDTDAKKLQAGLIDQGAFDTYRREIDATRAKIENGLNRPYQDFIQSQEDSLAVQRLISQGRLAEAEALRTVIQLQKNMPPLDEAHKAAILASVEAVQAEQIATDRLRQSNEKYLDLLGGIKGALHDASQEFVRGDLGQFIKTPGKLLDALMSFQGDKLFERIFGDLFNDLEDEVNGTSVVKDASARMAEAVDRASGSLGDLEAAAAGAAAAMSGEGWLSGVRGGREGLGLDALDGALGGGAADAIVVTGKRLSAQQDVFIRAMQGSVEKFADIFTSETNAKLLGKNIGTAAGKGLEGAATGTFVAGVSNALGIKLNSGGAQAGGALAGALGSIKGLGFLGGPIGTVASSLIGGLLGGLFGGKAKPGGVTISGSGGNYTTSATGRDADGIAEGKSLAGSITSGIQQIAEQLGGELGAFNVSIGTYKGDLRVNENGKALGGVKGSGAYSFGDDEQAATAKAIQLAIAQGAVKGLDAAVQKALNSSPDIDKALQEALGVKNLETMLGGVPGQIKAALDAEDAAAKERLRLARAYGLDVVAVEKLNGQQRLDLQKQLLDQQVGSLQKLVDEMTSGSLFEGSKIDRRTALLGDIAKARADVDAGVDGAADKLAGLFEQFNAVSKDVYGTTGGFATDRDAILDQARAAIAATNAQITAAQSGGGSDPALANTNAALDENNDQNARILSMLEQHDVQLKQQNTYLRQIVDGIGRTNLKDLARTG